MTTSGRRSRARGVLLVVAFVSFAADLLPRTAGLADIDGQLRIEVSRRRSRLLSRLDESSLFIVFSALRRNFERDIDDEYRQDSNLFYLTGITQPGVILVLMAGNESKKQILFLPPRDPMRELWTGKRLSPGAARAISGIETIFNAQRFDDFVGFLFAGRQTEAGGVGPSDEYRTYRRAVQKKRANLLLAFKSSAGAGQIIDPARRLAEEVGKRFGRIRVENGSRLIHEMRQVKSPYELDQLRRAVEITCQAQREAMRFVRPGQYEYEVEALIEYIFRKNGSPWPGFPSIVAAGPNATTLHYDKSMRQLQAGELLLADIGAEFNYYSADVTRTFPVSGRFDQQQARIYELVLKAQTEALRGIRPGATLGQLHRRAEEALQKGMIELGLITRKDVRQSQIWFPHGTSHWLGMNVHDVGDRNVALKPGMVFTVEPGLYIRRQLLNQLRQRDADLARAIEPAVREYGGIGVRIEDDVVVTETGFDILSDLAPKTRADIESLMMSKK